jgi:hypothetical protein
VFATRRAVGQGSVFSNGMFAVKNKLFDVKHGATQEVCGRFLSRSFYIQGIHVDGLAGHSGFRSYG